MDEVVTLTEKREIVAEGYCLTEAPRWHDGKLYFSDIYGHSVHVVDQAGNAKTLLEHDSPCSGLGFLPNGDLLISAMSERKILKLSGGNLSVYADVSQFADDEINDMVVDATGRAYVTQLGPPRVEGSAAVRLTRIIVVEPDGTAHAGFEGLQGPNGIAIDEQECRLVIAESGGFRASSFEIGSQGDLSNLITIAAFPDRTCPDGLCLDAQGGVWIAAVVNVGPPLTPGPGFCRFDKDGQMTHVIPLEPDRYAIACAFGGPERETLFLCTTGTIDHTRATTERSARIERIRLTGFSGAGIP